MYFRYINSLGEKENKKGSDYENAQQRTCAVFLLGVSKWRFGEPAFWKAELPIPRSQN